MHVILRVQCYLEVLIFETLSCSVLHFLPFYPLKKHIKAKIRDFIN